MSHMSADVVEKLVRLLQNLPDSDQYLVLEFLSALKGPPFERGRLSVWQGRNPAMKLQDGALVFTGTIDTKQDWLARVREEPAAELAGITAGE